MKQIFLSIILCSLITFDLSYSQEKNHSLVYYLDSRDYSTLSINSSLDLPLGFKLWGFTDFNGNQNSDNGYKLERFFMEYRVLHEIPEDWIFGLKGIGVLTEFNNYNGSNNDFFRFGPYISHSVPLPWKKKAWFQLRLYPYQTESNNKQISLSYKIPFNDKLSLLGFADINFIDGGKNQWVITPKLKYHVNELIDVLLEYRYNEFEITNPNLKGRGVALGMSIKF